MVWPMGDMRVNEVVEVTIDSGAAKSVWPIKRRRGQTEIDGEGKVDGSERDADQGRRGGSLEFHERQQEV